MIGLSILDSHIPCVMSGMGERKKRLATLHVPIVPRQHELKTTIPSFRDGER